ncbi:MAG: hypothetical protein EWV76_04030 [Microcystis novacekii Mn_MB_F_20050700_S1]|uniref:DUF262 domain-containing protein n=1 Tax=Microcystis novacekii Mn_MB_F_20050700_S1D TaxID=2486266 RepID=A0A552IJG2_9CHRO|nr:MAG: hypothetical protein EWV54_19760 [Microcystis novacekii Mn_MB_F_20050700_S1D]TRU91359.1 MAG: hypothetical protein EWV76_04030 [Microcystis novacekii Mn_MB_F_20050700_S1]
MLSVKHPVVGAFDQHKYEIIDGQQRIATFAFLVACMIQTYRNPESEAQQSYQISKSMTDIHARMLAKPAFVVTRIKKNGISRGT